MGGNCGSGSLISMPESWQLNLTRPGSAKGSTRFTFTGSLGVDVVRVVVLVVVTALVAN